MDKDIFVENVKKFCALRGIGPTNACKEAGVGGSYISDIKRGRNPSIGSVQQLAIYLGVTTSELLGEPPPQYANDPDAAQLAATLAQLNAEGREKLLEYADDLIMSGKYIKTNSAAKGQGLA